MINIKKTPQEKSLNHFGALIILVFAPGYRIPNIHLCESFTETEDSLILTYGDGEMSTEICGYSFYQVYDGTEDEIQSYCNKIDELVLHINPKMDIKQS